MKSLNEIIDSIDPETFISWLESYAEGLETDGKNEILLLNIDREDLENKNSDNISEIGSVEYGDWDSLKNFIPEEDVNEEIEESKAFVSEAKEDVDNSEDYDFVFHRALLLCEKQYVWSLTLYSYN
jgi:hypothetical protein